MLPDHIIDRVWVPVALLPGALAYQIWICQPCVLHVNHQAGYAAAQSRLDHITSLPAAPS